MPTASEYKSKLRPLFDTALNNLSIALMGKTAKEIDQAVVDNSIKLANATLKLLIGGAVPTPTPSPAPVPSGIDLAGWSIAGDTDAQGGFTADAKTWYPVPLDKPWLSVSGDILTFTARVDGATTSGSHYPRSELREMINGQKAAWKPSQGGTLTATLSVEELPVKKEGAPGRIVIGQIHGPNDELCRLYYDNGKIYFVNDKAGDAQKETIFDLKDNFGRTSAIPLGEKFKYSIEAIDGYLSVSVLYGSGVFVDRQPFGKFWTDSQLCYFKAGVYLGVGKEGSGAGTTGTGRGVVKFYGVPIATH